MSARRTIRERGGRIVAQVIANDGKVISRSASNHDSVGISGEIRSWTDDIAGNDEIRVPCSNIHATRCILCNQVAGKRKTIEHRCVIGPYSIHGVRKHFRVGNVHSLDGTLDLNTVSSRAG